MTVDHGRWQFWIDRGGTFTDIVARAPDGKIVTDKLLSENPERYADAAIEGIRRLMRTPDRAAIDAGRIAEVSMGTTVATNALLERKGARTLLITTRGLRDQLRIGYQHRPKLFVRRIDLPPPLYSRVIEIDERVTAQGEVLAAPQATAIEGELRAAHAAGFDSCAVVFMHGYRYPAHEEQVAAIARRVGFAQVSTSHDVNPLMKFVSRGHTTVADAYLTPILRRYVDSVSSKLGGLAENQRLRFMRSSGGLAVSRYFSGKDAILSGPAGGVVGMAETARSAGFAKVIGFDMGGTSTDVSRFDGTYERTFETEISGVRIRAPMLAVHTVAAGGGSILTFDGLRMRAGPESAGAIPGPACYRRGGPLTVTDANVMTGRVNAEFFPKVFGTSGRDPIDIGIVQQRFADLALNLDRSSHEIADGFLAIAVANMAEAIKKISVAQGADVSEYTLQCFGGAGAQLACRVADALSMRTILIHPLAGVLSAFGMGHAHVEARRERAIEASLNDTLIAKLQATASESKEAAVREVSDQGMPAGAIKATVWLHLRYAGTDTALPVPFSTMSEIEDAFAETHRKRFGFWDQGRELIVESISAEASGQIPPPALDRPPNRPAGAKLTAVTHTNLFADGKLHDTPIYRREHLQPNDRIAGPALIAEPNSTIVIDPHWQALYTDTGNLVLTRDAAAKAKTAAADLDPVRLEIFNALFMSAAEQMGATLEKTASSVNIKERLDFSCALFDTAGNLVANAPHMPVHLGSMGESVQTILRKHAGSMQRGDAYALNAPYDGGTHLPDITVVMPVFIGTAAAPAFYVASRGHHADIGGIAPGSMPPDSKTIDEEGALFDGLRILRTGLFDERAVRGVLMAGDYPSRNPNQNIADLKAQIASCTKGAEELTKLCAHYGEAVVTAYMDHVQDNAEAQVRRVIGDLKEGSFTHEMDDGAIIKVNVTLDHTTQSATVDFTGTSAQRPNNFNAPRSVTTAAVLYVFRCLINSDIPLNAGCLRPITIIVPERSMLNPRYPAAVVAGNVETSQAVTDTLFGALKVMAASQGTMNNFTFGNDRYQYYETICGGSGAGPDFEGTSAVHTHMTNSRLTDPEVLETRYPVLLRRFELRQNSGGDGAHKGGDGTIREVEFREPMEAGILSTRRRTPPFGIAGGEPGKLGRNAVRRANGKTEELPGCAETDLEPGDTIIIETPGGGGFGTPNRKGQS